MLMYTVLYEKVCAIGFVWSISHDCDMTLVGGRKSSTATDLAKVLFALSKITGEGFAAEWVNMKAEEILGNGEAGTWAELVEEMKRAFNDQNDHVTAIADIARLKQGTMPAPEF